MKKLSNYQLAKLIITMDEVGLVKGKMIKLALKELGKRNEANFNAISGCLSVNCSTFIMKKVEKLAKKNFKPKPLKAEFITEAAHQS